MPAEPTWFGPVGRRLAGWVHTPPGDSARGGVLVCPPTGLEYVNSHRALVRLANLAADADLVAFRFDYDGTGDSAGTMTDPDRIEAWRGSVRDAFDYLRSVVGAAPLGVVGLRLGLTLVADVVQSDAVDLLTMVAWDPAPSGRRFFREQAALGQLVGGEQLPDGGIDAPGFRYDASTVAAAAGLDLATITRRPAERLLVLIGPAGCRRPSSSGPSATAPPSKQSTVKKTFSTFRARKPYSQTRLSIGSSGGSTKSSRPTDRPSTQLTKTSDVRGRRPTPVTERLLRVGPNRMVAVESVSPAVAPRGAVMLLNNAVEHHVGPVRLWTETAREWATTGMRVLRIDLSGVGDSPTPPDGTEDVMYAPGAIADVREFMQALDLDPAELTLVGLCSGAHLAVHAGAAVGAQSVIAINPISTEDMAPLPAGPTVKFGPKHDWPRNLLGKLKLHDAARKVARVVRRSMPHLPAVLWRLAVSTGFVRSPATGLTALTKTQTLLVCGPEDSYRFLTKGKWDLHKLRSSGMMRFMAIDDLGHVPMPYRQRVLVTDLMTDFLEVSSRFRRRTTIAASSSEFEGAHVAARNRLARRCVIVEPQPDRSGPSGDRWNHESTATISRHIDRNPLGHASDAMSMIHSSPSRRAWAVKPMSGTRSAPDHGAVRRPRRPRA